MTATGGSVPTGTAAALGAFDAVPDFGGFLQECGDDDALANRRFVARNFRIDPQVSAGAATDYLATRTGPPSGFDEWVRHHNDHVEQNIERFRPALGAPKTVDPDSGVWPSTFSEDGAFRDLSAVDQDLSLIRVEDAAWVAREAGMSQDDLVGCASSVAEGRASRLDQSRLQAALDEWQSRSDLRPVFAAFWDDVDDILTPSAADAPRNWPDLLRDRLGLYHYDSVGLGRRIDILVLQYEVRVIPLRARSASARAIVRPTVLDGRMSEAFCPAPRVNPDGRAVDLAARFEHPASEVVHATPWYTAKNVFRVGTISTGVPADLTEARDAHLLGARDDDPDFAVRTDPGVA